jgi:hypothetical protein
VFSVIPRDLGFFNRFEKAAGVVLLPASAAMAAGVYLAVSRLIHLHV